MGYSPSQLEAPISSPVAPPPSNPIKDVIKGSDDEDSGSDFGSGLSDLEELMQTQRSDGSKRAQTAKQDLATPIKSTRSSNAKLHASPLAVLPKKAYKFNLKELTDYVGKTHLHILQDYNMRPFGPACRSDWALSFGILFHLS